MIIKLTNASKDFEGKPLLLNTRHILSVFEDMKALDDKTVETITNIYMVTQQSWSVKESIDKIYEMINGPKVIDFDPNDITMLDPSLNMYDGFDMTDEVIDPTVQDEGDPL